MTAKTPPTPPSTRQLPTNAALDPGHSWSGAGSTFVVINMSDGAVP